jgi:Domain of unknown function (DUF1876)
MSPLEVSLEVSKVHVAKHWKVDIYLSEEIEGAQARTYAEARLTTGDATDLRGYGRARKHPNEPNVPEIDDELAASQALSDLAHKLLSAAAADIEAITR